MPGPLGIFKFTIYFTLSFLILSFPFSQGTLFQALHKRTKHLTQPIYSSITSTVRTTWGRSKTYIEKVFSNAKPRLDEISTQNSSWDRAIPHFDPEQDFAPEEESRLKNEWKRSGED